MNKAAPARNRTAYWRERSRKRRQSAAYRDAQKKRYSAWHRKKGKTPERLAVKARQMKESTARHPERAAARRKVRQEISARRLVRGACKVCGLEKAEGHHEDYSKPLEVIWLCRKHHTEVHAKATGN